MIDLVVINLGSSNKTQAGNTVCTSIVYDIFSCDMGMVCVPMAIWNWGDFLPSSKSS